MHPKVREFFKNLKVNIKAAARKVFCYHLKKKKRIILWSVLGSLAGLALILGLLLGCISTVTPRSYGIHTSSVSQRTSTTVSVSGVYFAGLGAYYNQLPKPGTKFQIAFTNTPTNSGIKTYPSFTVRTSEGTLLNVDMLVIGQLNITNSTGNGYPLFFDKYGSNWMDYISFKVPNVIRRKVSNLGFYEVTNQKVKTNCDAILISMDEFALSIGSIELSLANGIKNQTNGTIGQQLYQKKAVLNFLTETYNQIVSTINTDLSTIQQTIQTLGTSTVKRDSYVLNSTLSSTSWTDGIGNISSAIVDPTALSQYLWGYFQFYYNSSFDFAQSQIQYK